MTIRTFSTRLFGGRNIGVTYNDVAGTIAIMGQSIALSSLSADLQAKWATAVANPGGASTVTKPVFGGDNINAAVGEIFDNQATWREAVHTAVDAYIAAITQNGNATDAETWTR